MQKAPKQKKQDIDIVKPLWWSKQTATLNDTDLNYLMLHPEDKYSLTGEKKIQKARSIVADSNKYHPLRDYLNGREWDGTERIRYDLPRFLGTEESEYTYVGSNQQSIQAGVQI